MRLRRTPPTKDTIIREAARQDIELARQDIGTDANGQPTIDGRPARQWLKVFRME